MAALLGVGLIAFEIVNSSTDLFAFFLAGTNGVDRMADHLQGLGTEP